MKQFSSSVVVMTADDRLLDSTPVRLSMPLPQTLDNSVMGTLELKCSRISFEVVMGSASHPTLKSV